MNPESTSTNTAIEMYIDMEQGSKEWLALRRTKITATDAVTIMGVSPYKTPLQLYHEKISGCSVSKPNPAMQRGLYLEPIAREKFSSMVGMEFNPAVVVRDWAMASLDGIDESRSKIVEIKCPGKKDHDIALSGKVPDHYYPQLQHQMYVCDVDYMFYFSFDGIWGVVVSVERNQEYIDKMIQEETKFYECLLSEIPPDPSDGDYVVRTDELWEDTATRWKDVRLTIKELEREEEDLKRQLIFLSGEANSTGAGISLCQVIRKGIVDYKKIPELQGVDLNAYRKDPVSSWRINIK